MSPHAGVILPMLYTRICHLDPPFFLFYIIIVIMSTNSNKLVLVTGGSGYVASHLILQLLLAGHRVRTTVRSLAKEESIRSSLRNASASASCISREHLEFVIADLSSDQGWPEAVRGCDYVQHVASPIGIPISNDEEADFIRPAIDGTLRVLRAARDAGVKRVIITSSFAAIGYGHKTPPAVYTEDIYSVTKGGEFIPVYQRSKALADRAAWEFIRTEGKGLELTSLYPTGIFGPVLSADVRSSVDVIKRMMDGAIPACPPVSWSVVDVRDLADLHLRVMTAPQAAGQRYIATSDSAPVRFIDIGGMITKAVRGFDKKMPKREMPKFVVWVGSFFSDQLKSILPQVGVVKMISNNKAKTDMGWKPRSTEECIGATAKSLVEFGIVKPE